MEEQRDLCKWVNGGNRILRPEPPDSLHNPGLVLEEQVSFLRGLGNLFFACFKVTETAFSITVFVLEGVGVIVSTLKYMFPVSRKKLKVSLKRKQATSKLFGGERTQMLT